MTGKKVFLGMLVFFIVGSAVVMAVPLSYTLGGDIAAINEKFLKKALKLKEDGNEKALKELEKAYLITKLKPKIDCKVTGRSENNSDYVKILLIDADIELWTTKDAIKTYTPEELQTKGKKSGGDASKKKGVKSKDDGGDDWN